jgi:hypothetical protein
MGRPRLAFPSRFRRDRLSAAGQRPDPLADDEPAQIGSADEVLVADEVLDDPVDAGARHRERLGQLARRDTGPQPGDRLQDGEGAVDGRRLSSEEFVRLRAHGRMTDAANASSCMPT